MVAVVDRCHQCGTRRASVEQQFCEKCGSELPAPEAGPADGMAWDYRIPLLDNRYTWIQWGWTALIAAVATSASLATLVVVASGSGPSEGMGYLLKVYVAAGLIAGATIIGYGLFAALGVGFGITIRFGLGPEGVLGVVTKKSAASLDSTAWMLTGNARTAQRNQQISALLLPSGCDAKWKDVRRAGLDEARHVITLRRRWHLAVRVYVPAKRFGEAAAFVRSHLPSSAKVS